MSGVRTTVRDLLAPTFHVTTTCEECGQVLVDRTFDARRDDDDAAVEAALVDALATNAHLARHQEAR